MTQKQQLDDIGGIWDLAQHRFDTAKENLHDARQSFATGSYRAANNRAYYAVFHAISACLAIEQKSFKSHAQVIGCFNKDFVHTGIFPKDLTAKIKECQKVREFSDYQDFFFGTKEETEKQIATADLLIKLVGEYLQEKQHDTVS